MKKFIVCLFLMPVLLFNFANCEDMRGVWVASVYNLDYPISPTTNNEMLKREADKILNDAYDMGLNAVFLQVRPSADALYKSNLFPWSKWLTGKNGTACDNDFDPLKYWTEQAHLRGIELHAWINPYRITKSGSEYDNLALNSPAKLNPTYVVKHTDGNYYFNPGIPEVRKLVVDGALEIVRNYDVDGIHMDDYFYPSTNFSDGDTYKKYGTGFSSIDDWRRNNVDLLIKEMGEAIHAVKPNVSFGISPFGIWANKSKNTLGSNTNGLQSYYSHYADTRKWALNNWIDYIAPQLYWSVGMKDSDYAVLLNWWADTLKDSKTKLYIGMADYKSEGVDISSVWYNGKEIKNQLILNENNKTVDGEIHYRYKSLISAKGIKEVITAKYNEGIIKVFVRGNRIRFEQNPVIENNRTLVSMRAIFEALGATVTWNGENSTVTAVRGETKIILTIGSKIMSIGKITKEMDTYAKIIENRTFVPLRAISEAFNNNVGWNGNNRTVTIE